MQNILCSDLECTYHKPFRGSKPCDVFPDPVPYDDDGTERYTQGSDPEEKFLPSVLLDSSKQPHGIPFTPTAQTAKNVHKIIRCMECSKPRLLHAAKKLKPDQHTNLTRFLNGFR